MVFLDELGGDADVGKRTPIVDLGKDSAFVTEACGFNENDIMQSGFFSFH